MRKFVWFDTLTTGMRDDSMLKERIESELKQAMKSGDALKLSVLRMLSAAVHNREIEKRTRSGSGAPAELVEDEIIPVIRSELKKRRDAETAYVAGGRPESAEREGAEAKLLESFLPPERSDAELVGIIDQGSQALGVSAAKDFGTLMGWVMARVKGQASGERVRALIQERFSRVHGN